jgi:3-deoxy-manno-octulosonate cytidylyltransferase (CMP-KDO synthetase)
MLWHVYQAVAKATSIEKVWILTDSQQVVEEAESWGADVLMTSEDCPTGTDRIASRLVDMDAEIIVNVQADEPLIESSVIDLLVEALEDSQADVATPVYAIKKMEDLVNPNVVKVVRAADGTALYFSRSPVPYVRDIELTDWLGASRFWGHTGIYAYRRAALEDYQKLAPSQLETTEKLEQLRLMEAGKKYLTVAIDYRPQAVDVPEDLVAVKQIMTSLRIGRQNGA